VTLFYGRITRERAASCTASYYFHRLREIICQATEEDAPLAGEVEVDESYFASVHKGKRRLRCGSQSSDVRPFKAWWQGLCEGDP
jgi:hypothetical protein